MGRLPLNPQAKQYASNFSSAVRYLGPCKLITSCNNRLKTYPKLDFRIRLEILMIHCDQTVILECFNIKE